ncbi:hypothetical protein FPHYL_14308 [Fusarium phyllophilum]|uniref:Uncharacterized protein n=1 Tax=Fusarium phyllophilum TaxID=47803 RepID=A0A8H5MHM9_9HYPO|nr:hypothetical protein FPHYL_14308 [Fusarium phyllophilum]
MPHRWVRDKYGLFGSSEILELLYWSDNSIGDAWPEGWDVAGVGQYIFENDGERTETKGHWSYHWWPSLQDRDTPYLTLETYGLTAAVNPERIYTKMPGTVDNPSSEFRYKLKGCDKSRMTLLLEDLDKLESVEELMFDNSFKRSKDYFVALQILRIIDEWDRSDKSFTVAIRDVKEYGTATKSWVRKKHEEINSLWDGLFNATSARESHKAMPFNQAIYIFTVITYYLGQVLYTKISS